MVDIKAIATSESVSNLRARFLAEYQEHPHLYSLKDVDRVKSCDFFVERFINFLGQGPDKGFDHMKETFAWRKEVTLDTFDIYPDHFSSPCPMFPFLPDLEGNLIVHLRPKICAKLRKETPDQLEKYCLQIAHAVDDRARKEFGWSMVLNCSDLSLSDCDLNFLFQILPKFRRNFPNGCRYCVVYGLHWTINAVCKVAMAAMPADSAKKVRFMRTEGELHKLIPQENLPDFLNGTSTIDYNVLDPKSFIDTVYRL